MTHQYIDFDLLLFLMIIYIFWIPNYFLKFFIAINKFNTKCYLIWSSFSNEKIYKNIIIYEKKQ